MKYSPRHKSYKSFKNTNIMGLVLVGLFLLISLAVYLVRNFREKKEDEKEQTFPKLTDTVK